MSATGLEVFDKTLQTTNIWLDEIMAELGPDRHLAWHVLGAVLRGLRDRLPTPLVAHLGSQLPILVRGAYYDQWTPRDKPLELRSRAEFCDHVGQGLWNARPVNVEAAVQVVFRTISNHVTEGQVRKVRDSLPKDLVTLWPQEVAGPDETVAQQQTGARR
jgi:uncharacterized protein (DUF2267 family)